MKKNKKNLHGYYVDHKKTSSRTRDIKYNFNYDNNKNYFEPIKCLHCKGVLEFINSENPYYQCKKCSKFVPFAEYQKMFINFNWYKAIDLGIKLYSWDTECFNCNNISPCVSYCINQSFGDENFCYYEPILLGSVSKLDNFIMKFCRSVNMFPNQQQVLVPTMFCNKCDAPFSYNFLKQSFLAQKEFDVEFNIKKDVLTNFVNLKVSDITKLLPNIVKLNRD